MPLSGLFFPALCSARVEGPVWLTGGAYGPEGGLLATVAVVAGTLYVLCTKRIYLSEEMRQLISLRRVPEAERLGLGLDFGKRDEAGEDAPK